MGVAGGGHCPVSSHAWPSCCDRNLRPLDIRVSSCRISRWTARVMAAQVGDCVQSDLWSIGRARRRRGPTRSASNYLASRLQPGQNEDRGEGKDQQAECHDVHSDACSSDLHALGDCDKEQDGGEKDRVVYILVGRISGRGALVEHRRCLVVERRGLCEIGVVVLGHHAWAGGSLRVRERVGLQPGVESGRVVRGEAASVLGLELGVIRRVRLQPGVEIPTSPASSWPPKVEAASAWKRTEDALP